MKKQTLTLVALIFGLGLTLASCTYKGECKCGSLSIEDEFDNKEDYDDAKAACELANCEWTKKL